MYNEKKPSESADIDFDLSMRMARWYEAYSCGHPSHTDEELNELYRVKRIGFHICLYRKLSNDGSYMNNMMGEPGVGFVGAFHPDGTFVGDTWRATLIPTPGGFIEKITNNNDVQTSIFFEP